MKKVLICFLCLVIWLPVFGQGDSIRLGLPVGHTGTVRSATFSPDGKHVLSSGDDRSARVWEATSGKLIHVLMTNNDELKGVKFSPDGKSIITIHTTKLIVWDFLTGKKKHEIIVANHHYTNIESVDICPNSEKIALVIADQDTTKNASFIEYHFFRVELWDLKSGQFLFRLSEENQTTITSAVFSPKESVIATSGRIIKLWNSNTGDLISEMKQEAQGASKEYRGDYSKMQYSSDGKNIFVIQGSNLLVWDLFSRKLTQSFDANFDNFEIFAVSPDNKFIATVNRAHEIDVWLLKESKLLYSLSKPSNRWINTLSFSPDANFLAAGAEEVYIWDLNNGNLMQVLNEHFQSVNSICYSKDGKHLLASQDKNCFIWNSSNGLLHAKLRETSDVSSSDISPDNKHIVLTSYDQHAKIWDVTQARFITQIEGYSRGYVMPHFCPKGEYMVLWDWEGEDKSVWHVPSGKELVFENDFPKKYWNQKEEYLFINDQYLAKTDNTSSIIKIFDLQTRKLLYDLNGHRSRIDKVVSEPYKHFNSTSSIIVASSSRDGFANIWNVKNGNLMHTLEGNNRVLAINDLANTLATYTWNENKEKTEHLLSIWDIDSGKKKHSVSFEETLSEVLFLSDLDNSFNKEIIVAIPQSRTSAKLISATTGEVLSILSHNNKYLRTIFHNPKSNVLITFSNDSMAAIWDLFSGKMLDSFKFNGWIDQFLHYEKSIDGRNQIAFRANDGLFVWDMNTKKILHSFFGKSVCLSSHKKHVFTTGFDGTFKVFDFEKGVKIATFFLIDEKEQFVKTSSTYYMASPKAASSLYYIKGLQTIGFDQLDIKYNRPDKVLAALGEAFGNPDTLLIKSYYHAWQKRVKKLGVDTTAFVDGFSVPESDFKNRNEIAYEQIGNQLILKVWGKDADYKLDRYNIWVNEVPIFGQRGVNIRNKKLNELNTTITITLSEGENKIESSVMNVNGIESYRIPLYVRYNSPKPSSRKIHFIGIGVDHYQQPGHDLRYAVKDIRDLVAKLKSKHGENLIVDTLFNQQVTKEKILALKQKLLNSGVNDKVIISFSGHGLLSKDFDYYLATYPVNFTNPQQGGLPYEDLEWLLDSIPPRQKLLLLDACHSGEVDKEELVAINEMEKPVGVKGVLRISYKKPELGLKNSFELMQELFANVNKGTGATIISASGGNQFAYEKSTIANGVFTYSILELMNQQEKVTVGELKEHVGARVLELTNGQQRPTSRSETLEFDWELW